MANSEKYGPGSARRLPASVSWSCDFEGTIARGPATVATEYTPSGINACAPCGWNAGADARGSGGRGDEVASLSGVTTRFGA